MKKVKKKVKAKVRWQPFPQKSFEAWFSEYVVSNLAIKFYIENKRWPKKIATGSVNLVENEDGSATLSVDIQ